MGMKSKMARIASVAAMMVVANGDLTNDMYGTPQSNKPKAKPSKGEQKKCKSCKHYYNYGTNCYCDIHYGWNHNVRPMQVACKEYERRKKK